MTTEDIATELDTIAEHNAESGLLRLAASRLRQLERVRAATQTVASNCWHSHECMMLPDGECTCGVTELRAALGEVGT